MGREILFNKVMKKKLEVSRDTQHCNLNIRRIEHVSGKW